MQHLNRYGGPIGRDVTCNQNKHRVTVVCGNDDALCGKRLINWTPHLANEIGRLVGKMRAWGNPICINAIEVMDTK